MNLTAYRTKIEINYREKKFTCFYTLDNKWYLTGSILHSYSSENLSEILDYLVNPNAFRHLMNRNAY